MKNRSHSIIESSYRTYHGKLFASLLSRFGAGCVPQIEDAIQNSFYKSLKSWKPGQIPDNKENWLYIVARNDVINQLKKDSRTQSSCPTGDRGDDKVVVEDLRLQTIMFLSQFKNVSSQAKVLFVLKNIFGLSIREISESTLLTQDAIYKSVNRTKRSFQQGLEKKNASSNL